MGVKSFIKDKSIHISLRFLMGSMALWGGANVGQYVKNIITGDGYRDIAATCDIVGSKGAKPNDEIFHSFKTAMPLEDDYLAPEGTNFFTSPQEVFRACADKLEQLDEKNITWVFMDVSHKKNGINTGFGMRDHTTNISTIRTSQELRAHANDFEKRYWEETDIVSIGNDYIVTPMCAFTNFAPYRYGSSVGCEGFYGQNTFNIKTDVNLTMK